MYADHTTTISDRKGAAPDEIIRQHKLGTILSVLVEKVTNRHLTLLYIPTTIIIIVGELLQFETFHIH